MKTEIALSTDQNANALAANVASIQSYADASLSDATRRAYGSDWNIFADWCAARSVGFLPADPSSVVAFLTDQADSGVSAATLTRRLAAIKWAHELKGLATPTTHKTVRVIMAGIRRRLGTAVEKKAAATADIIGKMVEQCGDDLVGKRDRALLLLGFAGALRRSELVALNVSDVEIVSRGALIHIRRSKTDQDGAGQTVAVPEGGLGVVTAILEWLESAGITNGAIFRSIKKGGKIMSDTALTSRSVALIVKGYANSAGLDADDFSGHSLRAGFITSAAAAGASLAKIQAVSRHKSVDVLMGYIRDADSFCDHAGDSFL